MLALRGLAMVTLALGMAACGDDDAQSPPGGGTGGASSCSPSATAVPCLPVTLPATEVAEAVEVVETIPSGSGGPLVDGEYEIVAHTRYQTMASSTDQTMLIRAALRIGGGGTTLDYAYVEDVVSRPDSEASGFSAAMCSAGTTLTLHTTCPDDDDFSLGYTAQGDRFSIFEEDEELRFQRRP